MSQEIEAAAGGALGGFFRFRRRKQHEIPLGTPCANCATPLQGQWCHQCGQLGEDFHRSIWRLIAEVFEGLAHFDGRVWSTLPDLFFRPAKLTRLYLDGHRAPQVPPFRLFLVVLVLIFLAGAIGHTSVLSANTVVTDDLGKVVSTKHQTLEGMSPSDRAQAKQALGAVGDKLAGTPVQGAYNWFQVRAMKVLEDPERFKLVLEQWSERFAFLMLPLMAGLLSFLFIFQRRFYVFDHTIFSLHSLSAVGLMLAAGEALSPLTGGVSSLILFAAPVHLFAHMRGVYKASILGVLIRMILLFIGLSVGVLFIILGLFWVGLNGMGD